MVSKTTEQLLDELKKLRERLSESESRLRESEARREEAEETLSAIRNGEVDALVVKGPEGDQIFTLKSADQPYRVMVEQMQEGAATLNPDGTLLYCNQRLARLLKMPLKDLIGSTLFDRVATEDRPSLQSLLWNAMNGIARGECELRMRDGSPVPVLLSVNALPSDELCAMCMVVTDLTEQKRNEQIVAEERLTRSILDQATEAIVVCDREGRIIRASAEARRLCGGDPVRRLFEEAFLLLCENRHCTSRNWSKECRHRVAALSGQTARAIEASLALHDGRTVDVLVSAGPLWGEHHEPIGCIISMTDIGNRKQIEEALAAAKLSAEEAKAIAEEASAAKDHFLAVLSHELRTPLTPVLATVSMLQNHAQFDPDTRESLEMIRRNVEMEARLIDDLLDVTRIVRGKLELHRKPVELCEVIRRAVEVCQPDIEARRLEFGVEIGPGAPYVIYADAARLQQVFWNLLKNSIKFTPQGGCVGIRCRRDTEGHAVAEVIDSGEGIDPVVLPRLFSPFEQGGPKVTRQFGGLGLGLTITKALVELHGGQIEAHSEGKGKGATFRVRLPLASAEVQKDHGPPKDRSAGGTPSSAAVSPLRILLVEDHGDTAKIMRRLLMADGHDVETAPDVASAIELAGSRPFDLLLSDLGLPDGSGVDLMGELRRRGHTMSGIALSGFGQEQDIQRTREAGFAEHITKPVDFEVLREALGRVAGAATLRP